MRSNAAALFRVSRRYHRQQTKDWLTDIGVSHEPSRQAFQSFVTTMANHYGTWYAFDKKQYEEVYLLRDPEKNSRTLCTVVMTP